MNRILLFGGFFIHALGLIAFIIFVFNALYDQQTITFLEKLSHIDLECLIFTIFFGIAVLIIYGNKFVERSLEIKEMN